CPIPQRRRKPLLATNESPRPGGGRSSKCRGVTAVHGNGHAGDIVAGRAGQPDGGARHVLGPGPSSLGDACQDAVMQRGDFLPCLHSQLGIEPPRQDGIDLDVVGGPGQRQALGELDDPPLAAGIGSRKARPEDRRHAARVDDLAAASALHGRVHGPGIRNALVRFVSRTLVHSSRARSCGGLRMLMPALLNRMSMRWNAPCVSATARSTSSGSVTSAVTTSVAAPVDSEISRAACLDFDSLRPSTAIEAPAWASPRAMPSPMPPLPPVTMATLPVKSNGFTSVSPTGSRDEGDRPGRPRTGPNCRTARRTSANRSVAAPATRCYPGPGASG